MEFRAIHRYAPMSARKARPVVNLVRGLGVSKALETLEFNPRRAAPMLSKLIRSAIANAGQEGGVEAGQLVVKHVCANDGPLKQGRLRWRPGPRGRASPIRKRSCHLEVILEAVEAAAPRRRRRVAAGQAEAADTGAQTGATETGAKAKPGRGAKGGDKGSEG
jgi:large subunit ribosomal protein L22